jgi:hypothetical protein
MQRAKHLCWQAVLKALAVCTALTDMAVAELFVHQYQMETCCCCCSWTWVVSVCCDVFQNHVFGAICSTTHLPVGTRS